VRITDVAFREGATTNIEVIDAQRRARDAETAAAIAEDAVRLIFDSLKNEVLCFQALTGADFV